MEKDEALREISEISSMQEAAIKNHPPKTQEIYNNLKNVILAGQHTDWLSSSSITEEETLKINKYITTSSFISAWYHLASDQGKRDKATHSCATLISSLGISDEDVFKKHFETESQWRYHFEKEDVLESKVGIIGKLKKLGVVLGAGAIAFVIYTLVLLGLSFLADFLKNNVGIEPWLFVDSFLKPIAIVFIASWIWVAGKFLGKINLVKYGRYLLILWVLVSVAPYFLSFLATPNG